MSEENKVNKKELILGDEFENALVTAADVKNNGISICKERNKNNYMGFYDIILATRTDVQESMNKKGKHKTNEDTAKIKEFKKTTSQLYKQMCDYVTPDPELDEGELTKVQKMVQKITAVAAMMRYIGYTELEDEFAKFGIKLEFKNLEEQHEMFSQDHIKDTMKNIFDNGRNIKTELAEKNSEIKTEIYESKVPIDLQYDKDCNPTGIKSSDFCKLVDIRAKMLRAKDNEDEQSKIKERAEKIAVEYIFQNARNELLNNKMIDFTTEE